MSTSNTDAQRPAHTVLFMHERRVDNITEADRRLVRRELLYQILDRPAADLGLTPRPTPAARDINAAAYTSYFWQEPRDA